MLQVANLSAWISMDGTRLMEYAVEKRGSAVSCWIASEVGKNFSLNWECGKTARSTFSIVSVDGVVCRRLIKDTQKLVSGETKAFCFNAVDTSPTTERPLMFSSVNTTVSDDDQYLATTNPQTGEIALKIYECDKTNNDESGFKPSEFTGPERIHEESMKALVHQVGGFITFAICDVQT
ncbi:hypothetical protein K435DRAFT_794036 [Dendrothele bispora CBS 962.96]|uniref:DUF7918 domain-containing protein n=1 Tax=Dendrothele bispora (strain CBS 962.96) TaxID=1314807 RepID=A0A4S8MDD1_DENBC|nr:hypothetical protein K435DRAFT_794036 [Dendrothele bispora CBS 962.96]